MTMRRFRGDHALTKRVKPRFSDRLMLRHIGAAQCSGTHSVDRTTNSGRSTSGPTLAAAIDVLAPARWMAKMGRVGQSGPAIHQCKRALSS